MKDEMKPLTIRFPAQLPEQLREIAQQNNRSLNGEILTAIQDHLKAGRRKAKKR